MPTLHSIDSTMPLCPVGPATILSHKRFIPVCGLGDENSRFSQIVAIFGEVLGIASSHA